MELTREYLTDLVYKVNGAAISVHKILGPGLLESVYHRCMVYELAKRQIKFNAQVSVPVDYGDVRIGVDLRCDLLIEDVLVVELKAVEKIMPIHIAQLLTYMKLLHSPIGLMINFNSTHIFSEGQKTYVNELYECLY